MTIRRQALTFEIPVRPEPQTFRVDRLLNREEIQFMRMEPMEFRRVLKAKIARELATYIAEKTQLIDLGDNLRGDPHVRVEITFHDRGTYENYLPTARNEGIRAGAKAVIEALPYGMNPGEVWE